MARRALREKSYTRYHSRKCLPLSENHRMVGVVWAEQRLKFQYSEWCQVFWSDETWINYDQVLTNCVPRKVSFFFIKFINSMPKRKERSTIKSVPWTSSGKVKLEYFGLALLDLRETLSFFGRLNEER